jgi:N-acetylglucosamine kinase-like BadF-type ATPase
MTGYGRFAVDAGGSHTRALVLPDEGQPRLVDLPSINPHATGSAADDTLVELLATVRAVLGDRPAVGWLASASADPDRIGPELARVKSAARRAGLAASVVVSNDVVPLLWGVPALAGAGVVTVCGTGSGYFGADGRGQVARAGGCEYLGSDEGGAVDIGLNGLRAAVRATDGRGPATGLVEALRRVTGHPVTALARLLAADPFPKQGLANLAPTVCQCWLTGDEVAGRIVRHAVSDLTDGVRAVRDALGLPHGFAVAAAGGVLTGCPALYRELAGRLVSQLGAGSVDLVTDTGSVVLAALDRCRAADRLAVPAGLAGRYAWLLATQTPQQTGSPRREHDAGTVPGRLR